MQELVTGTDHDQAPILHDPYPVRQGTGTEQVVGTDQYRFSFQAEMVQELHQLGGAPGIQAGGRLIHHDIVGVFQQEGGDLYFLQHSLGEGLQLTLEAFFRQADTTHRLIIVPPIQAFPGKACEEFQVLPGGKVSVQHDVLGDIGDMTAYLRRRY